MQATDAHEMDEPISPEKLIKEAYAAGYERPLTLDADGGVHARSMPRVRRFAGNDDSGPGTYTQPREVEVIHFEGQESEHVDTISTDSLIDDVARAMITGTRDKREGREPDPSRGF